MSSDCPLILWVEQAWRRVDDCLVWGASPSRYEKRFFGLGHGLLMQVFVGLDSWSRGLTITL